MDEVTVDDMPSKIQAIRDSKYTFQKRVYPWTVETFGYPKTMSLVERRQRVIEEAIELVQAMGGSEEEVVKMAAYVFSRRIGEPRQEIGGLQVCIAAAANALGIDMDQAREDELARCIDKVDVIRKKNLDKPTF
jgi:NTP pyrophosphatase (non-canonical NTP hydrolase)